MAHLSSALVAYGAWGVFFLALVDSIGLPLPATLDALLVVLAVKAPDQVYTAAFLAVLGSLGGNLALFGMAHFGVRRFVREVNDPTKPRRFRQWFHRYGLLSVFVPAAVPIVPLPLKFFVLSAGVLRTPLARFLVVILSARSLRYFGMAYLGLRLGPDAPSFLHRNAVPLLAIALAVTAVLVIFLRYAERREPTT